MKIEEKPFLYYSSLGIYLHHLDRFYLNQEEKDYNHVTQYLSGSKKLI